ncbi:MAG: hypothetical protein E2O39_06720 [Planctomycetota bacterium]|nr:MAG: hypothetical protein E2O39_06720 [Planctomycetota bacterium]
MTPAVSKAPGNAGFTILEVVLAMGILVIGMTVLISLLTFGAALSRTAAMRTAASAAIESVLADLEESMFPLGEDGEAGEPLPIVDREVPAAPAVLYSATAEPNPDRPLEYRVDVDMKWKSSGVQRTRRFTTIMLREIPFGERMRRQFVERSLPAPAKVETAR